MVKVVVLRSAGTNCNDETEQAFRMADAEVEQVHINEFIDGKKLDDFDVLALPGGFSYGDYISAGAILANQLGKIRKQVDEFIEKGKVVVGICNGFQVLVKAGLLPGEGMKATLAGNENGRFECRWVKIEGKMGKMNVPVAHAEGRFIADKETLKKLEENSQVAFRYSGSEFPANPNGSMGNIAGISNKAGNVIGLMPHPERHLTCENHPEATRRVCEEGEGLEFFRKIIRIAEG